MAKYTVHMTTTASLSIDVEVPDGLDPDEAREQAIEKAYEEIPSDICAQCSGWGQNWSRETGEWEAEVGDDAVELRED